MRFLLAFLLLIPLSVNAQRTVPTADVILNVAPTAQGGIDNAGCTAQPQSQPCATPQYAFDALYALYDLQCKYRATVQLLTAPAGSYYFYPGVALSGRIVGQCGTMPALLTGFGGSQQFGKYVPITLQGDTTGTNPLGAFLNPGSGGRPSQPAISITEGAALYVRGLSLDTTLIPQDTIDVFGGATLVFDNLWFGNSGSPGMPGGFNHLSCAWGSTVIVDGNYGMSGHGYAHMDIGQGCNVYYNNNLNPSVPITVTINSFGGGALNFPWAFFLVDAGTLIAGAVNFNLVGATTVTGPSVWTLRNGVVQTSGSGSGPNTCSATYFPGNLGKKVEDNAVCR